MLPRHALVALAALVVLPSIGFAQNLNVKCGFGAPSAAYGAGSGQTGTWNGVQIGTLALLDVDGQPTNASAEHSGCDVTGCGDCTIGCGSLAAGTDDAALLGTWFNGDCYADPSRTLVTGLDPGRYALHVYAYHACTPTTLSAFDVAVLGPGGVVSSTSFLLGGVVWSGTWSGFPYHTALVSIAFGQTLRIGNFTQGGYGGFSGFQLTRLDGIELACAGDGTSIPCPCGNSGAGGHGCASSLFPGGGFLSGWGIASTATDTVVLQGSSMPNASCTYFQGTLLAPTQSFDGILCVSGQLLRLGSKINAGNASTYPQLGDAPVSVRGLVPAAGGTYYYTVRYRNAAAFCTPATANFTNAIAITWAP